MANNPFDDDNGSFYALINREAQHSLWPTFKPVPGGWNIVYGEPDGKPRQEVLHWIGEHWTDIRPNSLRDHLSEYEAQNADEVDLASKAAPEQQDGAKVVDRLRRTPSHDPEWSWK